jgi:predicted ester cyclase
MQTRRSWLIVGLVLGVLQTPLPAQSARLQQQKALVQRWIDIGFNQRNPGVVEEMFSPALVVNGERIGRDGLRQSMSRFLVAFDGLRVTITAIVAEDDKVALWYDAEGVHRGEFNGIAPTGKRVRWSGSDLLRIQDGAIVEARFLDDALGLMRQLGGQP